MATKLYFHNAASGVSGTLPSTNQSALSLTLTSDAVTVNRTMNTTIGSSQTSKTINTNASVSQQNLYYTRFLSVPLGAQTISANTWDYNFAASQDSGTANFPCNSTSQPVYINCYVWRPSTGAKVGTILEGNSGSTFNEPNQTSTEKVMNGTFSGSSLAISDGDVLVFEQIFRITMGNATTRACIIYFDGTTENTTANTTVSNHASFIQTPQNLTLASSSIDMTVTTKTPVHPKPIRVV